MGAIAVDTASSQPATDTVTRVGKAADRRKVVSAWSCLLVSHDERLRGVMRKAASNAGWSATECGQPQEAIRLAFVHGFPLAVVDVTDQDQRTDDYANLIRVLRSAQDNLVVVCDRLPTAEHELWSRQEGAWMYLPNVDEQSDLARICREAKNVIEKIRGPAAVTSHRG